MALAVTPTKVSRIDLRYLRRTNHRKPDQRQTPQALQADSPPDDIASQTSDKDSFDQRDMSQGHRSFHRRAALVAAPPVVIIEVINTVDELGNIIAQETVLPKPTPVPAHILLPSPAIIRPSSVVKNLVSAAAAASAVAQTVPTVAAFVAEVSPRPVVVLPSVPAVPQFPSGFAPPSVPSFPWPSGDPNAHAAAATQNPVVQSPAATSPAATSPVVTSPAAAAATGSAVSFTSAPSAKPQSSFPTGASTPDASSSLTAFQLSGTKTAAHTSATASDAASSKPGALANNPAATAATGGETSTNGITPPLPTPQVVGSIVGSLAGAALILAIILLLLRRHKRRRKDSSQLLRDGLAQPEQQSMSEALKRASLVPSAFLHRFSGMSRSTADTNTSVGERSFQRVSGRKLPSAFSEGMTSDQFSRGNATLSGSSFYLEDQQVSGFAKEIENPFDKEILSEPSDPPTSGQMSLRPSPARTPIIRHAEEGSPFADTFRSHLSPPQSPNRNLPRRGALGRSLHSADGSRSSRFTENV